MVLNNFTFSLEKVFYMVKIYTKIGDNGETSLFGGRRVSKADLRVEAYGSIDELNSVIGLAITAVSSSKCKVLGIKKELIQIQHDLLKIGSHLANPDTQYSILNTQYFQKRVEEFEKFIDQLTDKLPQLSNFILPGGGEIGSLLHFCRTVCRRAERRIVAFSQKENVHSEILIYFNRLSDLLFVMARYINHKGKKKEIIWRKV